MAITADQIDAARKEGYTDAEILQHLSGQYGDKIKLAQDEGYSPEEIISYLSQPQQSPASAPEQADRKLANYAASAAGALAGFSGGVASAAREEFPELFKRSTSGKIPTPPAPSNIPNITIVGSPASSAPPAVNATDRMIQGGIDEASGTTGRARQTAYNERTAQQAAQKAKMDAVQESLKRQRIITGENPFTASQAVSSTPMGISAPEKDVEHLAKQRAANLAHKTELESRIAGAEQNMAQRAAAAAESAAKPAASLADRATGAVKAVNRGVGHALHGMTNPWGVRALSGALSGASAGFQGADAIQRLMDPNQGVVRGLVSGLGAIGSGAAMSRVPVFMLPGMAASIAAPYINEKLDKWAEEHPEAAKRLHLAEGGRADLLMEGLKATNTVRNFKKGGPSVEDLLDYYKRSNVGIKSGARRAREAQYVHDIVPTHMFGIPKQIGIQDLQREKAVLVPVAGDRTLTGHKLRAVNNVPLRNEVELEGGPFYGQKEFEQGRPGFWASNDSTAQGFQNMLARGADRYGDRPFYGLYGAMDYDAGNFAKHNTRALYEQIDAMNPSRAQIKAFDKYMRQQYPEWVGIKDEESLNQLLGSVPMRKFFAETLNKPTKASEFGMPSGEATVHAITEPGLREVPIGNMGFTVGKLDPRAPITLEPTFNETYNRKIPGTPVGQMKAQLHWSDYFPDAHKEIMSNPRQAPNAWGTFKMGDYYQPVTQEMVDRIAPIEEAISKHSDIILPGQPGWFKKGGSTSMDYRSKLPKGGPFPWSAAPEFKSDLSPREMAEQAMRRKMLQMGRGMDTWKNTSVADKLSAAGSNIAAAAPEIAETAASFHPGYGLGYAGAAAYDYLRNGGDPISTGIDVAFNAPGVLGAVGKGVKAVAPYARTMGKVAMNEGAPYARRAASVGGLGAIGVPTATASEGAREMSQGLGNLDDAYLQPELAQDMSDIQKPINWPHMAVGGETAKFLKKAIGVGSRTIEGSPHTYPPLVPEGTQWMRDYTPTPRPAPQITYIGKYRQGTPEERATIKAQQEDAMRSVIESRKAQWLQRSREMGMTDEEIAAEMNSPWGAPWMPR